GPVEVHHGVRRLRVAEQVDELPDPLQPGPDVRLRQPPGQLRLDPSQPGSRLAARPSGVLAHRSGTPSNGFSISTPPNLRPPCRSSVSTRPASTAGSSR